MSNPRSQHTRTRCPRRFLATTIDHSLRLQHYATQTRKRGPFAHPGSYTPTSGIENLVHGPATKREQLYRTPEVTFGEVDFEHEEVEHRTMNQEWKWRCVIEGRGGAELGRVGFDSGEVHGCVLPEGKCSVIA